VNPKIKKVGKINLREGERDYNTIGQEKEVPSVALSLGIVMGGRGKNKKDFIGQRKTKSTLYSPNMGMYVHTFY
jgi:hypothetical protein